MKFLHVIFVLTSATAPSLFLVSAQQNADANETMAIIGDEDVAARPDWQPVAATKYPIDPSEWKSCTDDSDCGGEGDDGYFCLSHMWEYNGQIESGQGCWSSAFCSGTAAYDMFDGRKLQFWCSDKQSSMVADVKTPPFGLTYGDPSIAEEHYMVCKTDADCSGDKQQCLSVLWDATEDGLNYSNMVTCYNWDEPKCPGENFATQNMNYENTDRFSYHNDYSCTIIEHKSASISDGGTDGATNTTETDPKASNESTSGAGGESTSDAGGESTSGAGGESTSGAGGESTSGAGVSSNFLLVTSSVFIFIGTLFVTTMTNIA